MIRRRPRRCSATRRSWSRSSAATTRSELVAASHSVEEINRYVTSDSLSYLSHDGMMSAVAADISTGKGYCSACFTGKYPVALGQGADLVTLRRARV